MAAMFATFILQVVIRYTARLPWVAENMPFLQPTNFGWTLEFCLAIWVWLIFWGNSFVVRVEDHVTFGYPWQCRKPAPVLDRQLAISDLTILLCPQL